MQTVPTTFNERAAAGLRKLAYQLRVSFDKTIDEDITFFILDTSLLDGVDILAPDAGNEVQISDRYIYEDYTDRVVQMEWSREESVPYSVNLAMADLVLNNYDKLFTRGAGGPIDAYLLPRRPIRLLAGFSDTTLPQFVGLTETVPRADATSGTATVHAIDFLSYLFSKPLDQTVIYENVTTDEVLAALFELFGLLPGQYVLDEGFNVISFVYFEKGSTLGDAIKQLMQAELGSLYMDEVGVIHFSNRLRPTTPAVLTFDETNTVDYRVSDDSSIINVVVIKSSVREVQENQLVLDSSESIPLIPGENELFFSFVDPVTSIDPITDYTVNSAEDGSGVDMTADVDVADTDLFATSVKITFDNTTGGTLYLTQLAIMGTPAKVVREIYLREQNDESVADFDEQILTIDNNLIQDESGANSIALSLLNFYSNYSNGIELEVKGNHALQVGDNIAVDLDNVSGTYNITKIINTLTQSRFRQILHGKIFETPSYFILSDDDTAMSLLNGEDVLAP